ncbi:MAG: hypothetical protein JJ966_02665 [Balneolaceae bacterium]|nr:hypothetical protein [Balneolaceae bacterium]
MQAKPKFLAFEFCSCSADLISNTYSIVEHDPGFAKVYLREKELLLEVLKEGDHTLWKKAKNVHS